MPTWLQWNGTAATSQIGQAAQMYAAQHTTTTSSQGLLTWMTATATTTAPSTYWFTEQEGYVEHGQYVALAQARAVHYRRRTEAERIAEEEATLARLAANARRHEMRQAALARSRDLLLAHLTPEQRRTFEERRCFVVVGGRTRTRYRIRTSDHTHNIDVLSGDDAAYRLCAHCRADIPLHDHHLAQKLSLECDEEYFLSIANRSAA